MLYEYNLQKGQVKVKRHKQPQLMLKYPNATHSTDVQEQDHTSITPLPVRCLERLYCPSICLFSFLIHGTSNSQSQVTNKTFWLPIDPPWTYCPSASTTRSSSARLQSPFISAGGKAQRTKVLRLVQKHRKVWTVRSGIPAPEHTVDNIHSTWFLSSAAICRLYCSMGCWSSQAHQLYIRANFRDLRRAQSHLRP